MSIINQMLRDLDARGAASNEPPAVNHQVSLKKRRSGARLLIVLFVLLSAGGLAGVWVVSNILNQEPSPPAVALVPPRIVAQVPAIVSRPATPVEVAPVVPVDQPVMPPLPAARPEIKPEPVPVEQKQVVVSAAQTVRPSVAPQPITQKARDVPAPATMSAPVMAEPAVVKKLVESTPQMEAQQLYDDAQALRRAGKDEAAMVKYRLALERNSGMQSARVQLARLLQDSGQSEAALTLLKAGYEHKPDDGLAIAVGRLLADQGRREEALGWLERGRDGLRPADHALMGAMQSQTLRYEAAVKSYQRALSADPNQGGWLLGLGLAQEAMGRIEEAHVTYRNALDRGEFKPDVVKFLRQKLGMPSL
jgi:MSHA biogenesis protein MshN